MHLHTEICPNLKSVSELFKMYMNSLGSFILVFRDIEARHSAVSAFTETVEFLERSLASMLNMRYCCSMFGFFCIMFWNIVFDSTN